MTIATRMPSAPSIAQLLQALTSALGPSSVLVGEAVVGRDTSDWSQAPSRLPLALVMPRTTAEVSATLRICNAQHQPVVVQGGLTGLVGGANPQGHEVAVSLARLNRIEELDAEGATIVVEAGVTLQAIQEVAASAGFYFPLDLGARGTCQVGGNAATNAGGNRVLRFGMMRNLVLGLEAVLADGTTLTMLDRVIKNNAGFDLKHLFIGSEGTLGVITRLSLALMPKPAWQGTALCAVPDFPAALSLLRHAKAALPELTAFELMWQQFLEACAAVRNVQLPFGQRFPLYVLIEGFAASEAQGSASFEQMLESAFEAGLVHDAIIAQSQAQVGELWAYREGVSELLSQCKPCAAFDVSVAIPRMNELVDELKRQLTSTYPTQQHLFFGHLGDGNLHLISGPYPKSRDLEHAEEVVYSCVGAFGGSISAEHGIGVLKRDFLHHSRSPEEIRVMQQLKQMMDPHQILNRGRVIVSAQRTQQVGVNQ